MDHQPVAWVTGASRGIGLSVAKKLAEMGYYVVLSATRSAEMAANAIKDVSSIGECTYFSCDISDAEQRKSLFAHIRSAFGRLDFAVNNAGVAPLERLDILETSEQSFDRVININLRGTFFMCQSEGQMMISARRNKEIVTPMRIVNISSMSAYTSSVNRGEYCISKAGISMVTTLFADRLSEYGIGVYEIRPGIIKTDMTAGVREKYDRLIESGITPIRRWGDPDDVARAVGAIASGAFDFSTGEVFNVDGGFHIQRL